MDKEKVDGKPCTWVGAFVYSHEEDENVFVGALRFKGEDLVLDRKVANFVEVYGRRRPVSDIPKVIVTFGRIKVNGQAAEKPTAYAIYPKGVPAYADAVACRAENPGVRPSRYRRLPCSRCNCSTDSGAIGPS